MNVTVVAKPLLHNARFCSTNVSPTTQVLARNAMYSNTVTYPTLDISPK